MAETDTSPAALRHHAVDLEQCSLFVDSDPLKRAMTDAAATLRALAAEKEAGRAVADAEGWIPWEGGECPVADGRLVTVRFRNGEIARDIAMAWAWYHGLGDNDIIAYRLSKEG